MQDFQEIVQSTRNAFNTGITKDINFREAQLKSLQRMYNENSSRICDALKADLNKCDVESTLYEISYLKNDIEGVLQNLRNWTAPEHPSKDLVNILDKVLIHNDPYGVVLIIGTWNYPFLITLQPLASAIAAGNCCILKPSELTANSAALMTELIPKYLHNDCYKIVNTDGIETAELLKQRFDYILFTGSGRIGKLVHEAASKFLTPVTMELGGKCPVYIDESADIDKTAARVMWGKCLNAGQTCIAPDYVLCTKKMETPFIRACRAALKSFYGNDVQKSSDYCRIINLHHFDRLFSYLKSGRIAIGGKTDREDKFIAPTVLTNVDVNDDVMSEEIFGPILPIIIVEDYRKAIEFINAREKPLAAYVFAKNNRVIDDIISSTSSGGVTVNDIAMHFGVESLPFGGVGNSGMGAYHGKYTFDMFTHKKSTLVKDFNAIGDKLMAVRYPPYSSNKLAIILQLLKRRNFGFLKLSPYVLVFGLGFMLSNFIKNRKK